MSAAAPKVRFATQASQEGPEAAVIMDEAVSLLRRAPLELLCIYYLGALPFALGLIYFWSDMVQGVNAETNLPAEALLLTALLVWMKTCQAFFARKLLCRIEDTVDAPWTVARWSNTFILQAVYAGTFVMVYPLAAIATVPFGWVHAFYHNVSITASRPESTLRSSCQEAVELSRLWPKQNHLVIGITMLGGMVLFLNFAVFFLYLPKLLEMLLGLETIFDENLRTFNNSSFYLEVGIFSFLVLNPLSKAVYALRAFYGRSRLNGADLTSALRRTRLRRPSALPGAVLTLGLLLSVLAFSGPGRGEESAPSPAASAASPDSATRLDHAIDRTLQKDEFAWRMPRAADQEQTNNWLNRALKGIRDFLRNILRGPAHLLSRFLKWLVKTDHPADPTDASAWKTVAAVPWRLLFLLLVAVAAAGVVYWLVRHFRRPVLATLAAVPQRLKTVDLEADDIRADELPEDSWLQLARAMLEAGEFRLALRAYYLATLSVLAHREWIRLATTKSNRDYLSEMRRRLRGDSVPVDLFSQDVRIFEASWYGTHPATPDLAAAMGAIHEQMKNHVAI